MGDLNLIQVIVCMVVVVLTFTAAGGNDGELGGLPYCGPQDARSNKKLERLLFVSTLDGKVTALNTEDSGSPTWSVDTGPGAMLSSSIHDLELTNNGQQVRMIPSLSGALYRFNGESIEAIPITADSLLQSTFLFSDELILSGGKESRTYAVDANTGRVLYECSMTGCDNFTESRSTDGGVLVVQRVTQTIRAVETRTGVERWNFSVAIHDVKLSSDCHGTPPGTWQQADWEPRVIVPEGLVCAVSRSRPGKILWKHKFTAPVVSVWQVTEGHISNIDLFGSPGRYQDVVSPSLYIGMHNRQLYIQESVMLQHTVNKKPAELITDEAGHYPRFPWQPVPATETSLQLLETSSDKAMQLLDLTTTALSVLYASEYVNGQGYYLYTADAIKDSNKAQCEKVNTTITIEEDEEDEEGEEEAMPVPIIIVSLWYWWKEVLVISVTSAMLVNVLITRRLLQRPSMQREVIIVERASAASDQGELALTPPPPQYASRYLEDFDSVVCLGRGGFGVVFEARNKIDDCHYAVKRIALPNRAQSRERVMREVRALAKLEHSNIVRYFNAWLECPPVGWQEEQDSHVPLCGDVTSIDISSGKSYTPSIPRKRPVCSISTTSASDSFIKFEASSEPEASQEETAEEKKQESESGCVSNSSFSEHCAPSHSPEGALRMFLFIQMQLCRKDSLREWLRDNSQERDLMIALRMFEQIVCAVEYVHLQGLIHRDLKPSNIFFSMDGQIKVGDFGLVTAMAEGCDQRTPCREAPGKESHTAQVGTQLYMSPEQAHGQPYNYKVDIYSLGVILFELLVPFSTEMERIRTLMELRRNQLPEDFHQKHAQEFELLQLMLSHSPDERPTTYGIRARPPFAQLSPPTLLSEEWHFELPSRRRDSSKNSLSNSSSVESWEHV